MIEVQFRPATQRQMMTARGKFFRHSLDQSPRGSGDDNMHCSFHISVICCVICKLSTNNKRRAMKYRHLFFDLDHTLWDFEANSRQTLEELYQQLGLEAQGVNDFDRFHKNYLMHNDKLW